ncbi:hypothetical protein CTI12_AA624760 [Artemisia annua]|uniref:Uncharacterized protein n=1 Tax=Artemisia annua TaxID=35608 RepID=A0A2U1KAQ5_ARTAN|nr:hypothetical protein CTI12_AA624760 [Artemisia annua]
MEHRNASEEEWDNKVILMFVMSDNGLTFGLFIIMPIDPFLTMRYHSQQWRTWGACFIQVAWRRHQKRKHEAALWEEEKRLQDALAKGGETSSSSLRATIYASKFATNMLHKLKRNRSQAPKLMPPSLLPQKPVDLDFSAEDGA